MTSVRFVGELPLWIGTIAVILAAAMSWRYYRRETTALAGLLRWLLPLLRAAAFGLGILVLTGPVLRHRQTTGELGRVRIYIDGSQSMGMTDAHIPVGRKLLIARALGWLNAEQLDGTLLTVADQLADAQQRLNEQLSLNPESPSATTPGAAAVSSAGSGADSPEVNDNLDTEALQSTASALLTELQ
ncbi:MAG: hypothetical protein KDA85_06505, partial [Planctomycetaceae bacterium]|nr:hypothetical protein [Planctomycetaceae bacterium]